MRIASWGPLAQDVLYILASTVKNQKLLNCSVNYEDGNSYIYIKAVGHVGERPNIIVVKFNGTVKFPDVGGKGPLNDDIKTKFKEQTLTGVSIEHTKGPEGLGGKPVAVPTTTSNPDFWDSILTDTVLKKITYDLSLLRKSIGGSRTTKSPDGKFENATKPLEFEYEITVSENPGEILLQYSIKGHVTRDREHKVYAPVIQNKPRPTVPDLLKANEEDREGYLKRPFTMRAPNAGPAYDVAPEAPRARDIRNRTTRNPMLEYFLIDVPDAYVSITEKNLPKTVSMLYTVFKGINATHEGKLKQTKVTLPVSFWQKYFELNPLEANEVYNAIDVAWGKRTLTSEEIETNKIKAQQRADERLMKIIEENPLNPNDLDLARMEALTKLPKRKDRVIKEPNRFGPEF